MLSVAGKHVKGAIYFHQNEIGQNSFFFLCVVQKTQRILGINP
jgi:hypothetical protein